MNLRQVIKFNNQRKIESVNKSLRGTPRTVTVALFGGAIGEHCSLPPVACEDTR